MNRLNGLNGLNRLNTQQLRDAMDKGFSHLEFTANNQREVLSKLRGEKVVKKKMSVGLVCAIVLVLVAVTAVAVTTLQAWTNKVADMQLDGVLRTWGLKEKVLFIDAMREAGLAMDEMLYATLTNLELNEETRNAAADKIIDERYGDMMREMESRSLYPSDTVVGTAPNTWLIYRDAYFIEHPNATEQEFTDAYGYWLRDLGKRYEASIAGMERKKPKIDEAYAIQTVEVCLIDYFSIPESDVNKLNTQVEFNEEHNVWVCKSSILKADVPNIISNQDGEIWLTDLGDAWEMPMVVDASGRPWRERTLEQYLVESANEQLWNYDGDELEELAKQGVMREFGLTAEEVERYFTDHVNEGFKDENRYALYIILFKEHRTAFYDDWKYAVMLNAGTGEVMECVDAERLWAKLPEYAAVYPTLTEEERIAYERWLLNGAYNPFGGYEKWTDAQKAEWNELLGQYVYIK